MIKILEGRIVMKAFETIKINHIEIKNRLVYPPTYTCMGVDSEEALAYYTARAQGGAGIVIVESTDIDLFKEKDFVLKMERLASSIFKAGAIPMIQLRPHFFMPNEEVWVSEQPGKRELLTEEIQASIQQYGLAAGAAQKAGFLGVDVHGAHGFLLNKMFSVKENQRKDQFGGSLENRMRYGLEIVTSIRKSVSKDFLVFYRHTPFDPEGGYTMEESLQFAKALEERGIDVMDISPSMGPNGEFAYYAVPFKKILQIPVLTVNGFHHVEHIEEVLENGKCDLVGIGRGLIADPDLPNKLQSGNKGDIIRCIECDKLCYGNMYQGKPISCVWRARKK